MSNHHAEGSPLVKHVTSVSPQRPKHLQTRSITEVSPPTLSKPQRPHHHHHYPHIHKKERETQSAHPNLHPSLSNEGSKSEGVTPNESRDVSRRGSVWVMEMDGTEKERRVVREGEVNEEKEKGILMASELRNALLDLSTLSHNTTSRLDNTYYSVLEKLSTLQNTIMSLKELANMTRDLNEEFKTESGEVVSDITKQLDTFGGFTEQENRIHNLEERVQKGRERIKVLGGRVDAVQDRVEGWEKAEWEWQEKTRKRLRIMWTLMSIFAAIIIMLMVFQRSPTLPHDPEALDGRNSSLAWGKIPDKETLMNETWALKGDMESPLEGLRDKGEAMDDDPRLRVFDEL